MGPELSLFLIGAATAGSTLALGLPIARRCRLAAGDALVAAMAIALIAVFLGGWAVYVFALPLAFLWLIPAAAPIAMLLEWRAVLVGWRDVTACEIALGTALVAAACVAWLATVASYSGGGWAADWYEHWERAQFFLQHGSLDTKFLGRYALTARPPLANVVTGVFLHVTRNDFAHYQLFTTLLASLAFAPAALLAARWGRAGAIRLLVVFVMVSPMFVQNATFAWTKLPAAFFVLTALYFFLRAHDDDAPRAAGSLSAACLAAGILTHYSAAPYAVLLAAAWFVHGWQRRTVAAWWRATARIGVMAAGLLATWFGWSLANLGVRGTFLTNSSVTSADAQQGNQLVKVALNLVDTVVPHLLRRLDGSLIAQTSPWGAWRDAFFQCYQINLLLGVGSVAWLVLLRELAAANRIAKRKTRTFWITFITGSVFLGVAAHGQRDHWGLAHICLQPLLILGLAFLAARWHSLGSGWRVALIVGATIDFIAGIALQFSVESFALDRWFGGQRPPAEIFASYNESAVMNLRAKIGHQLTFFSDVLGAPFFAPALLAIGLLALAVVRANREPKTVPAPCHGSPSLPGAAPGSPSPARSAPR